MDTNGSTRLRSLNATSVRPCPPARGSGAARLVRVPCPGRLEYSVACADVPLFSQNTIAPLYGRWIDRQSRNPEKYDIGPKWITAFHGDCPYGYRYRITNIKLVNREGKKSWVLELEEFAPEFLGKKASMNDCFGNGLANMSYVYFGVTDVGASSDAPIAVIDWQTCDTAEDLEQLLAGHSPAMHGCGGGIRDRL